MPETIKNNPMDPDEDGFTPAPPTVSQEEFFLVFGKKRQRREFKSKQDADEYFGWYAQQQRNFGGVVEVSELEGYAFDTIEAAATEAEFYGLGRPSYYVFKDEIHVFFPAVLRLNPMLGESVDYRYDWFLNNPGVSIGRTQARVIRAGHWVVNVHFSVPPALRLLNDENMLRASQASS